MNAQDTRLFAAAAEVRAALTDGAGIKARNGLGRTALLLAALGDHVETARVLVAAGADPDAQGQQWGSPWSRVSPIRPRGLRRGRRLRRRGVRGGC
ncbi:hypothetical protein [Streptomyces sp. NPDC020817]|uniref:hypothetical protein n=1 Tax=Streptomyces sp. NPDC020817 TaxID=3365095 RepID=UPI0037AA52E5